MIRRDKVDGEGGARRGEGGEGCTSRSSRIYHRLHASRCATLKASRDLKGRVRRALDTLIVLEWVKKSHGYWTIEAVDRGRGDAAGTRSRATAQNSRCGPIFHA